MWRSTRSVSRAGSPSRWPRSIRPPPAIRSPRSSPGRCRRGCRWPAWSGSRTWCWPPNTSSPSHHQSAPPSSRLDRAVLRALCQQFAGGPVGLSTLAISVDEAAMAASTDFHHVLTAAHRAGARVILVGDHHQLPEINAGGVFAAAVARRHGDVAELTINRRQHGVWEPPPSPRSLPTANALVTPAPTRSDPNHPSRTPIGPSGSDSTPTSTVADSPWPPRSDTDDPGPPHRATNPSLGYPPPT
jgi:AAA domain